MGVWGWTERRDGVMVSGVVQNAFVYDEVLDTDWNVVILPDSPNAQELMANEKGQRDREGRMWCEVKPREIWSTGVSSRSDATEAKHLTPLIANRVTITGTWSRDHSHTAVDNKAIVFDGTDGKMEIHPMASMLCHLAPKPTEPYLRFRFYVFSDDSNMTLFGSEGPFGFFASGGDVPHKGENRVGAFSIGVPEGSNVEFAEEVDMAAKKEVGFGLFGPETVVLVPVAEVMVPERPPPGTRHDLFQGIVESGTIAEGKGFYFVELHVFLRPPSATLRMYYATRRIEPSVGLRSVMSNASAASLRQLFGM